MTQSLTLWRGLILICVCILLCSCLVSTVMTGAQLIYDRHDITKDMSNYTVQSEASRRLFKEHSPFKQANITVASFNHDLILLGQVPSPEVKKEVAEIVRGTPGARRLFNEIEIRPKTSFTQQIKDAWITTKIRTKILADSAVDPKEFKIITEDAVVYVLGDVRRAQAMRVVEMARNTSGVRKVIRILRYYHYLPKQQEKTEA